MSTPASLTLFDLVPGKVLLDRYHLLRSHRQSGMAAGFEVEDKEAGDSCELQAFPAGLFEGLEQATGFAERMKSWQGIECSILPDLREVRVLADGSVVLVSGFPAGRSLRDVLSAEGRQEQKVTHSLGLRLLEGLCELHGADRVHGDIKPQTIYVTEDFREVHLVDGGVTSGLWAAKHLGTRTALIGTPYYAPLEQFSGDAPDVVSDLYNLATVLYEVVAGVLPWTGKGFLEVFQSKMSNAPPSMRERAPEIEVDPRLERVIVHGLEARRGERYQSPEEFLEALRTVDPE